MGLLKEADFIPSEEWLGEYMGQQGLRYALNKTPEEVDTEGETVFWLVCYAFVVVVVVVSCDCECVMS